MPVPVHALSGYALGLLSPTVHDQHANVRRPIEEQQRSIDFKKEYNEQ